MFWNCEADTVNRSTYAFMGLDAETSYTVEIYAYNIIGNSETRSTEVTTASPSVGIDHEMAEGIQIFPNPALDFLQIEGAPAEPSWKLFNLKGQVLSQGGAKRLMLAIWHRVSICCALTSTGIHPNSSELLKSNGISIKLIT